MRRKFLTCAPPPFNCIITNPPFSIKEKFLARCYQLGKPFALLMPITTFDSRERRKLFHRHGMARSGYVIHAQKSITTHNKKGLKTTLPQSYQVRTGTLSF